MTNTAERVSFIFGPEGLEVEFADTTPCWETRLHDLAPHTRAGKVTNLRVYECLKREKGCGDICDPVTKECRLLTRKELDESIYEERKNQK